MPTSIYDSNCIKTTTSTQQTLLGVLTIQTQEQTTCDDPLKTQTGGLISFAEIGILVAFGFWFLMYHGKKEIS